MRIIYECGCDGKECERHKVVIGENGNVIEAKMERCNGCKRNNFIGEPWIRISVRY